MPVIGESQGKPSPTDPDALTKALELELIAKRAGWQRAKARRGVWRGLSLFFLLLVALAALVAYFYIWPTLSRAHSGSSTVEAADSTR